MHDLVACTLVAEVDDGVQLMVRDAPFWEQNAP